MVRASWHGVWRHVVSALAFAVVCAAGAWTALAENKPAWAVVAAAVAAPVGAFAPSVLERLRAGRALASERRGAVALGARQDLPASVALLLQADQQVVPFFGRGWVLQTLESWAAEKDAMAVRLVVGAGGVGKTRLAREFGTRLSGWDCVWVRPGGEATMAEAIAADSITQRRLLVVDYAETRDRAGLAALMCAAQRVCSADSRTRVLLLARHAGLWWETMSAAYPDQEHVVDVLTVADHVIALPVEFEGRDPQQIVSEAVTAFARKLKYRVPELVPKAGRDPATPILRLHAEALVAVLGAPRNDRFDVLDEVLRHEARYWRHAARRAKLLVGDDPEADVVLRQVTGISSLLGAHKDSEVAALVVRVPSLTGADAELIRRYVAWLRSLYPTATGVLGTVQPDLLGETLAVEALRGYRAGQRSVVFSDLTVAQAAQALTVLARACEHQLDAQAFIEEALTVEVPTMTEAVLEVAMQFPGRFSARMASLLASADLDPGWTQRIASQIAYPSLELGRVALALTTRIVADMHGSPDSPACGTWMNIHAIRLAEAGRRDEALIASQKAVDLRRDLTAGNRDVYLPELAASVNNHAIRLAETGRRDKALDTSQEAVAIYRELAADNRETYLPDLAASVNNHAIRLAEAGQRDEALTASQEAVDLRRDLAAGNRDAYLPDLATSVNNHAIQLAEAGRQDEALTASQEAVDLRRDLVAGNRDVYLPGLATSANNHANRLAKAGRRDEALAASQEAVDLYRELADGNRDAYLPGLATSVNNHALRLAETGRRDEALATSQEAVDLYRDLAAGNRDAYLPDLATLVSNHAIHLAEAGRRDEALATSQEAVDLHRDLAAGNRDAYLPGLAKSMSNLPIDLAQAGRRDEALTAAQEAVDLHRMLAAGNQDAYLPDLAKSLWNIGVVAAYTENPSERALAAITEAIELFLTLAAAEPDAFTVEIQAASRTRALLLEMLGSSQDRIIHEDPKNAKNSDGL
ncbi:tetratricopeptide repeat protein [Actinoplanes sp. NPDC023714]|uniref:tetratricopeptide repeat protein n=1 Tax=Actinoplanes sp. NPDC023714 TaxID=3154322 RepID=UPI0033F5A321